jgi:hypothetical protein
LLLASEIRQRAPLVAGTFNIGLGSHVRGICRSSSRLGKMRTYHALFQNHAEFTFQTTPSCNPVRCTSEALSQSVNAFSSRLPLNSGLASQYVWQPLQPNAPAVNSPGNSPATAMRRGNRLTKTWPVESSNHADVSPTVNSVTTPGCFLTLPTYNHHLSIRLNEYRSNDTSLGSRMCWRVCGCP